jgi:hypothetical protein
MQYILRAAAPVLPGAMSSVCIFYDNQGVIAHSKSLQRGLPDKQAQSDLMHLLKSLVSSNGVHTHWEWVEGHAVESRGWCQCTLTKKMTYYANELAKLALQSAISGGNIISGNYPLKPISVLTSGTRVTGSPCLALEKHWGYKIAHYLYSDKQFIHETDFHLVWWEGINAVMDDYPRMYHTRSGLLNMCWNSVAPTCRCTTDTKAFTIQNVDAATLRMNTPSI